jgi:hypothetical protein
VCPSRAKEAADSGIFDLYSDRFSAGPSPPYVALPPCTVMMRMEGRRWGCLVRRHHHMETGFRQQQAAEERGEREADGLCTGTRRPQADSCIFHISFYLFDLLPHHHGTSAGIFATEDENVFFFFSLTFFTTQKRADARLSLTGDFIYSRQIIRD